jgi:ribosomal protein S18 acetylase RimI-like enzyme
MDTVATFTQYTALTAAFALSHSAVQTNCYLLPDELRTLLDGGGLRYANEADDLLLMVDQRGYSRLYFYTATLTPVRPARLLALQTVRQPVLLDLVTRNPATIQPLIEAKWMPSGFCLHSRYLRMRLAARGALPAAREDAPTGGAYRIRTDDAAHIPEILALWEHCLDPYSIALPDGDALQALMAQSQVFYVLSGEGALCAAALANRQGAKVTLQHVCVHPDFRRQGLARLLLTAAMQADQAAGVANWLLWVAQENLPAVQLYQSLGFEPDGTVSAQLILTP